MFFYLKLCFRDLTLFKMYPEIEISSIDFAELNWPFTWGRRHCPVSETLPKNAMIDIVQKPVIVSTCFMHMQNFLIPPRQTEDKIFMACILLYVYSSVNGASTRQYHHRMMTKIYINVPTFVYYARALHVIKKCWYFSTYFYLHSVDIFVV